MTLNNFRDEARNLRMTPEEKQAMKSRLFGAPTPVMYPTRSPYLTFQFFAMRAVAGIVLVLIVGGGTAYAAEGALPGQPLYAVKINVNEPVEVALATTPQAKVAVETQLAQRRVAEAEALASQGSLDATTSDELEHNFDEHAQAALALAANIGGTPAAASSSVVALAPEPTADESEPAAKGVAPAPGPHAAATLRVTTFAASQPEATSTPEVASTTQTPASSSALAHEDRDSLEHVSALLTQQRALLHRLRLHVEHQDSTTTADINMGGRGGDNSGEDQ